MELPLFESSELSNKRLIPRVYRCRSFSQDANDAEEVYESGRADDLESGGDKFSHTSLTKVHAVRRQVVVRGSYVPSTPSCSELLLRLSAWNRENPCSGHEERQDEGEDSTAAEAEILWQSHAGLTLPKCCDNPLTYVLLLSSFSLSC